MNLETRNRLSALNIIPGKSTIIYDMGFHRHLPLMVEEIDNKDGTLWCMDQDGGDHEIDPEHYQNILSVENL